MNSTAIAIAISLVVGGAAGSAATAVAISFSSVATCPTQEATRQFFTPPPPLPTTGYATYGAKDYQ